MFRWSPSDAMSLALRYAHAQLTFATPADFRRIEAYEARLGEHTSQIELGMLPLLNVARQTSQPLEWVAGLKEVGLTDLHLEVLSFRGLAGDGYEAIRHDEVERVLSFDLPFRNPYIYVWELRQMHAMYEAAHQLLTDALFDLVAELAPTVGFTALGAMASRGGPGRAWQEWLDAHRQARGEPGGPGREMTGQTYGPARPLPFTRVKRASTTATTVAT